MPAAAISIHDRSNIRTVELRHLIGVLPDADSLSWQVVIEDFNGGPLAASMADELDHAPRPLSAAELRAFAFDVEQLYGGTFVGYAAGMSHEEVAAAVRSKSTFEASGVRYIVRDIRGDEWIVVARDARDLATIRAVFRDVRAEDAAREFGAP